MRNETLLEAPSHETSPAQTNGEPEPQIQASAAIYKGINIGADKVADATKHLPEDQRALLEWLFFYCREHKWTWSEIKTATGFDSSTLFRVWTDTYKNPKTGERISLDGVCDRIQRFKDITAQREAIKGAEFVETSVWERVDWLCHRAFIRQKIGFLYGESQIGKTTALKEHQRRNNHGQTIYVEMPPSSGVQLMTRYIARALFVPDNSSYDNLMADIMRVLNPNRLLVLDEIHRVFTTYQKTSVMRCLDALRHIHDTTKCGMVLCGTNVFQEQLETGYFSQYLKQLKRRGLYEVQLPSVPPRDDLDLIAAKFGLDPASGEAEQIMLDIAKTHGFGMFTTRLTDAAELAAKKKQPISWSAFIRAHDIVRKAANKR